MRGEVMRSNNGHHTDYHTDRHKLEFQTFGLEAVSDSSAEVAESTLVCFN